MVWDRKVNTKSTIPGPQGPQGIAGVMAIDNDHAVADYISTEGSSETKTALRQNGLTGWYHVEGNGVAVDGVTDSTAELQQIFVDLPWGGTVYIPETGWDKFIKVSSSIVITKPCRVLAPPKDTYISSIRSDVPGLSFFDVKAAPVTFENVGIYGDGTDDYGSDATQIGITFYGTPNGDVDTVVKGCGLTRLETAILLRGRNAIIEDNLFVGDKYCVQMIGPDSIYHTGPTASDHRGHVVRLNRFHGCGAGGGAFVRVQSSTQLADLEISNNYFDQLGGRGFVIEGTSTTAHNRVNVFGNRGMHLNANMYEFSYVNHFTVRGESINGAATGGDLMVLNNCLIGEVSDIAGFQLGGGGVTARNCSRINFDNVRLRQLGNAGGVVHGFDVDATNSQMSFDNVVADEYTGWGFTGSPTDSRFGRYSFRPAGGALGTINSSTFLAEQIFVSALEMAASAGAPSLSSVAGGVQSVGWLLDPAATESVAFQLPRTPVEWTQFSITLLWAPTTAAAGNVSLQYLNTPLAVGAVAGGSQTGTVITAYAAPGVANQVVATTVMLALTPTPTPLQARVIRVGGDAGDTYAADIALLGVLLTRTR